MEGTLADGFLAGEKSSQMWPSALSFRAFAFCERAGIPVHSTSHGSNQHLALSIWPEGTYNPHSNTITCLAFLDRYTNTGRRAIFFAWMIGFASDRDPVTSVDLLAGLLWDDDSRAQTLFHLREYFPLHQGRPWKYATLPERTRPPVFDKEIRRIFTRSAAEATRMGDYWIDTEHLLLGILLLPACRAAQYLTRIGLSLDAAREAIEQNKSSRPSYGAVPRLWALRNKARRLIY
jgi:ClpA/ClpB-like protein